MDNENKVAVISIIVESGKAVDELIGRMGIPYKARGINIISVALDAPRDTISTLAGRLGNLPGVSVKTAVASV